MSGSKYGFGGGLSLPAAQPAPPRKPAEMQTIRRAVEAGNDLGFVNREPSVRLRPGPKRVEPQDKVSIPGPQRVTDRYRTFCAARDLTLWQGLELLMDAEDGVSRKLRVIAAEERTSVDALLDEAIDLLLLKRGRAETRDLSKG